MGDHECVRCSQCDSCPACAADALDREVVENERLRERLDQFEAYAITVKSALDDRADRDALRKALREIEAKCDGPAHGIARRALAASERNVKP